MSTTEAQDALNCDLDRATIRRRPGFGEGATAPNGKAIDSQFDYRQLDGTRVHLVKAGDQLYSLAGTTFTAIGSAVLEEDNLAQFVVVGGKCFIVHGGTPKVTDGASLHDWQITQPPYAPTLSAEESITGVGLLTGLYDYKITFYSSTWGVESPSSPPTNEADTDTAGVKTSAIEVVNQAVNLANLPTSADSRVDMIRVYRRKISNREADWYFVEEIPMLAGAWADQTLDNDLENRVAPTTYSPDYPKARLVAHHLGVTYVAGIEGDPSSIWYTRPGTMALADRIVLDDDGGEVSGLLSFQGQLVTFTSRSIWLLNGVPPSTHVVRQIIRDRGCLAPFSIVPVDGMIYFLSENGVYAWTGSGVVEVSRPVKDLWLARNFTLEWKIRGVHDISSSSVWWVYARASASANDAVLVFFYRNSAIVGTPSWARWDVSGAQTFEQITDPDTNSRKVFAGFSDGRVAMAGSAGDDNGTAIEWFWETGDEDVNVPTAKKHWGQLVIETDSDEPDGILSLESAVNGTGDYSALGETSSLSEDFRTFALRQHSSQIALRINVEGDAEIVSWAFGVERSVKP